MRFNLNKGAPLGDVFYQKDNVIYGPFRPEELAGLVNPDTLVYQDGGAWTKAQDAPVLSGYLSANQSAGVKRVKSKPERKQVNAVPPVQQPPGSSVPPVGEKKTGGTVVGVSILVVVIAALLFLLVTQNKSGPAASPALSDSALTVKVDSAFSDNTLDLYKTLSSEYISDIQISRMNYAELINYQNELLARHGFIFDDMEIANYYRSKSWYKPENNFLMASSAFTPVEKANFELLERKNVEIKTNVAHLVNRYYASFVDGTFDANNFFADRISRFISKSNLTPNDINSLRSESSSEFVNPRFVIPDPLELKYQRGSDGVDYFLFRIFYTVFRTSKNKFQSCYINLKWGINENMRISSYEEVKLDDLKFTEAMPEGSSFDVAVPSQGMTNTWMVIVASFRDESDALGFLEKNSAVFSDAEVINTNRFVNLAKDLYVVSAGKGLTREDAESLSQNLRATGLSPYIKEAGSEKN